MKGKTEKRINSLLYLLIIHNYIFPVVMHMYNFLGVVLKPENDTYLEIKRYSPIIIYCTEFLFITRSVTVRVLIIKSHFSIFVYSC